MPVTVLRRRPSWLRLYTSAAVGRLRGPARDQADGDLRSDLAVRLEDVPVREDHVQSYREVCGFGFGEKVPSTYVHVLAFPLHLALMNSSDFPFPAMGMVHVANTISQGRPLRPGERLDLEVRCRPPEPHPRGHLVTLISEATSSGTGVWSAETTLLRRGPSSGDPRTLHDRPSGQPPPTGPVTWDLPAALGRRYASVSGDRNPIHLYDATARAFGFRRHIAHGMWTKARCLAELENRLPDAYEVTVEFKRPIPLPGAVRFGVARIGQGYDMGVTSADGAATHLLGRIRASI